MKKIMILDDDPQLRTMLKSMLNNMYSIIEAEDVDQAIKLCKENDINLIITDLFMPGKSGLDLIEEIKKSHPHINILAVSGGNYTKSCDFLPIAEIIGANETLHKPFTMGELREKVRVLTQ